MTARWFGRSRRAGGQVPERADKVPCQRHRAYPGLPGPSGFYLCARARLRKEKAPMARRAARAACRTLIPSSP